MHSRLGSMIFRLWVAVGFGLVALSCSNAREGAPEVLGTTRLAVIPLEPPTTVESGTPSPRTPKCPGRKLPDQCGSWAGVELQVSRTGERKACGDVLDEHCLCDGIDFQIPAQLPVTRGKSGWDSDKPRLTFRTSTGREVECRYRGNGTPPGKKPGAGGDKYLFERCSDGSKAGQTKRGDWFELELDHGAAGQGFTEVELRLGEPDVVGGVVQEQIFYADDARIAGAALHVPRGSAPAFETFSLELRTEVPLGTLVPNENDPSTTISRVVDVHADSTDAFVFTPVPGAPCARIELPYDQATLDRIAGPGGQRFIQAQQLTTLTGVTSGAAVLVPAGAVTVDVTRRTFSFCVEHLSFWVGTAGGYDADLSYASIQSTGGGALPPTPLLQVATLPTLNPHEQYELTLGFERIGGTTNWLSNDKIYLVAVGAPAATPPIVTALSPTTPWGLTATGSASSSPVATNVFTPASISIGGTATFKVNLTAPTTAAFLNFCLRNGVASDSGYFGDCFSWDLLEDGGGTAPVPLQEICDNEDNDGDNLTDEGVKNACGACGPVPTEICDGIDNDCDGSTDEGLLNACGACGPVPAEICDGIDNDCSGFIDDGCPQDFGYGLDFLEPLWSPDLGAPGFFDSWGTLCPVFHFPDGLSAFAGELVDSLTITCARVDLLTNTSTVPYQYDLSWLGAVFRPGPVDGGPPIGQGTGGTPAGSGCAAPGLMTGIRGNSTPEAVVSLGAECASLVMSNDDYLVETGRYWAGAFGGALEDTPPQGLFGGHGGEYFEWHCPANKYVVQVNGTTATISNGLTVVQNVKIACAGIGVRRR